MRVFFDRVGGYGVHEGFEILEFGVLEPFFYRRADGYGVPRKEARIETLVSCERRVIAPTKV